MKAWGEKNDDSKGLSVLGLSRQEILQKHFAVYGRMLDTNQLRQQILPMLETAGLIVQEADQNDKRKMLIYPTTQTNKNNSENQSGVNIEQANNSETQCGVIKN